FGSVGRLDRPARQAMRSLLLAVDRQDGAAATTALRHLLVAPPELDLATTESRIGSLVMSIEGMPADELFNELFRTVVDLGFKVPPAITAAFRCLGDLEGTLTLLDPECDVVTTARTTAMEQFRDQLEPISALESGVEQTASAAPLVGRVPTPTSSIGERLVPENLGVDGSPSFSVQRQVTFNYFGQLVTLALLTTF